MKNKDKQLHEVYYRIIPQKLVYNQRNNGSDRTQYIVYLEKGMQIVGKSTIVVFQPRKSYANFPVGRNLFDFQIINQKYLNFSWSLYKIGDDNYEERISDKEFSVQQYLDKYKLNSENSHFFETIKINKDISIKFQILLQKTADYIMKLTSMLLPELSSSQTNFQKESEISGSIQEYKRPFRIESTQKSSEQLLKSKPLKQCQLIAKKRVADTQEKKTRDLKDIQKNKKNQVQLQYRQRAVDKEVIDHQTSHKIQPIELAFSEQPMNELPTKSKYPPPNPSISKEDETQREQNSTKTFEELKIESKKEVSIERIETKTEDKRNWNKIILVIVAVLLILGYLGSTVLPQKERKKKGKKQNKRNNRIQP